MSGTKLVNFRADETFYQEVKAMIDGRKVTVSDILNAALRKVATGAVDAETFVTSDTPDTTYQVAFDDLKREILQNYRYMPIEQYITFYYIESYRVYVSRILNSRQDWAKLFNK